ncbi:MAG: VanZ family protein [Armatimonadetes bacterium]|nr:VanZ family protein [Armatimonadota bacterium]
MDDGSAPPTRTQRLAAVALFCGPLVAWLAVIALTSTDIGSSAHSDTWIWRLLSLFFPGSGETPADNFSALSWALRKTAHLVEYAVLGFFAAQVVRRFFPGYVGGTAQDARGGSDALWRMAPVVVPFGALVAALDELHQASVPSRTGSVWDALLDVVGVSVGLLVVWLIYYARRSHRVARRNGRVK